MQENIESQKTGIVPEVKAYDVVVVGFGAAGAVAAITAAEAGGKVIILEKAPHGGGNSATAAGGMKYPVDAFQAANYIKNLGLGAIDTETARIYAETWTEMVPWLLRHDIEVTEPVPAVPPYQNMSPPEKLDVIFTRSKQGYAHGCGRDLFNLLEENVKKLKIDIMLNAPAKRLIRHPVTGEISGVEAEILGKPLQILTTMAVILTPGGFAANPRMLSTFIEEAPVRIMPTGTPYNTGDGISLAVDVGADLWHMNGIEWATQCFLAPGFTAAHMLQPKAPNWINVNRTGKRFRSESTNYAHAKKRLEVFNFSVDVIGPEIKTGDADWPNSPWYLIFDENVRKAGPVVMTQRQGGLPPYVSYVDSREIYRWSQDNAREIKSGWIIQADELVHLAQKIKIDPAGLKETVQNFNRYCRTGSDPDFHRKSVTLKPLDSPPYYALECVVGVINTQGGPKRNARGQIIRALDSLPIPRLYGGGEFGSIWGMLYPGGGNLSECIVSGLIAGRNAMAEKQLDNNGT